MTTTDATSAATTSSTTTSSTAAAAADAQKQKNQFLQMLLTQLQNQNPLNAMDSTQFASQLAQYSQLEQQIDTNSKLDSLISAASTATVSPLSYLGTTVDYDSATAPVQNEQATWTYSTSGASKVSLLITDSAGDTVYSGDGDISAGNHTLTLDSLTGVSDGTGLTLKVTATDASGNAITPVITSRANIDAVDTSDGTTTLEAGGYSIKSSLVKRIATTTTAASDSNLVNDIVNTVTN
jgi:flagellar basal-body rod modification protein FlgD